MSRTYKSPIWPHAYPYYLLISLVISFVFTVWLHLGRYGFAATFFLTAPFAWKLEQRRKSAVQEGVNRRGPGLCGWKEFNRQIKGDGLAFFIHRRLSPKPAPLGRRRGYVRIKAADEPMNIGIVGDTGSGKTSLMKQILYQIRQRGDVAVLNDPKGDYLAEFGDENSIILNPADCRSPYWCFADELPTDNRLAVALTIMHSLFPPKPNEHTFFPKHVRQICAYLIAEKNASPENLIDWASHPEEIDIRVKGTEHEATMTGTSPEQRAGLLGTLNEIIPVLRMLPKRHAHSWSAREFVRNPKGWIFITGSPMVNEAVRPIQSMWLDLLLVNQLEVGKCPKVIWNVYDELDTLKKLPRLPDAMTKMRHTGNRMVIGFHNTAQIEEEYGKLWKSVLSQCFTYFVFRTREPDSARWLSGLIGSVSNDRIRETRNPGTFFRPASRSYSEENREEGLVIASEIQTLPPTQGYLSYYDLVLNLKIPYFPRRVRPGFEAFRPRKTEPTWLKVAEPVTPRAAKTEPTPKQLDIDYAQDSQS